MHIFQAVTPFLAISLLVLALVFFAPPVAVWLPNLIG
jgi:TRAP-type C4-dicarboxylate transport system permease large subunit